MKLILTKTFGVAVAALLLGSAAQAQQVVVRSLDAAQAAQARAAIDASMKAAKRGQRVGMITGTANPRPSALRSGGVSQELDASTLMFSVARVNSEGQIERVCVSSAETAEQAVHAPTFAKRIELSSQRSTYVTQ